MNEFDAYAPPEADVSPSAPKKKSKKKKSVSKDIAHALERLEEHLADAKAVELDRKEAGGRLRIPTIVFIIVSFLVVGATVIALNGNIGTRSDGVDFAFGVFAAFIVFLTIILVVTDLRFVRRDQPAAPEETLKYFFRAITLARLGYAWASLCPTAREQMVESPALGDIPVGPGTFTLRSTKDLKDYTQTFARPGNGQMRTMQIKRASLIREDGDVAIVEVQAVFQAWPQWAQIVSVIGFVIMRLLGAVLYFVLFLALRKTHEIIFRKTLIRGSNGVWYVYSPELIENPND